jgi:hypothetical protein
LFEAVVLAHKEQVPNAVLEAPVVLSCNELLPTETLFDAVFFSNALDPTATF